ncbi:hypothetical protein ACRWE6_18620, partial [Escherichia coli]
PRAFVVVGYKVKDVTDVHGAAEPIDFHEPDWHGGQCQSGSWIRVSGSTVLTGKIANGERLPLPSGFSASQCTWSVSNAENPHGWKPNYFAGSVATYDSNRIVKCGYYDEYNFHGGTNRNDLTGKCSYIVVCQ